MGLGRQGIRPGSSALGEEGPLSVGIREAGFTLRRAWMPRRAGPRRGEGRGGRGVGRDDTPLFKLQLWRLGAAPGEKLPAWSLRTVGHAAIPTASVRACVVRACVVRACTCPCIRVRACVLAALAPPVCARARASVHGGSRLVGSPGAPAWLPPSCPLSPALAGTSHLPPSPGHARAPGGAVLHAGLAAAPEGGDPRCGEGAGPRAPGPPDPRAGSPPPRSQPA